MATPLIKIPKYDFSYYDIEALTREFSKKDLKQVEYTPDNENISAYYSITCQKLKNNNCHVCGVSYNVPSYHNQTCAVVIHNDKLNKNFWTHISDAVLSSWMDEVNERE